MVLQEPSATSTSIKIEIFSEPSSEDESTGPQVFVGTKVEKVMDKHVTNQRRVESMERDLACLMAVTVNGEDQVHENTQTSSMHAHPHERYRPSSQTTNLGDEKQVTMSKKRRPEAAQRVKTLNQHDRLLQGFLGIKNASVPDFQRVTIRLCSHLTP